MEKWRYSSTILDVAVGLTPPPLQPVSIRQKAGWATEPGLEATENRKILPLPGIEPLPSSPSLYQLSYTGSTTQ
jgi:hypothetical protein